MSDFQTKMREAEEALRKRRGLPPASEKKAGRAAHGSVAVSKVQEVVDGAMSDYRAQFEDILENAEGILREKMQEIARDIPEFKLRQEIVLTQLGETIGKVEGLIHSQFNMLAKAASVKDQWGNRKNIILKGPMGGGKSTAGKKLAEGLGLDFDYLGQTELPHDVTGYVHPVTNEYHDTAFVRTFRDGGVFMAEEMDAWSPRATLVLNVPLANGYMTLPNGDKIVRHPDCIIIACANTWGQGATAEYVGRNRLDAAFLDRFAIKIDWQYDMDLERAAAGDDEVVDAIQTARYNAEASGIKVAISPRSSIDCADMVRAGFTLYEAMRVNFLAGLDADTINTILEGADY